MAMINIKHRYLVENASICAVAFQRLVIKNMIDENVFRSTILIREVP